MKYQYGSYCVHITIDESRSYKYNNYIDVAVNSLLWVKQYLYLSAPFPSIYSYCANLANSHKLRLRFKLKLAEPPYFYS